MMHEKLLQHYFEQENSEGDLSPEQWETVLGHVKTQKQRRSSWGLMAPFTARGAVPAIAATLVLAVTAGVMSLWMTAPWEGSSTNGPTPGWGHIPALPGQPGPLGPRSQPGNPGPPGVPAPIIFEPVWKADKSQIAPGESITITLTLQNAWDRRIELTSLPTTAILNQIDTGAEEPIELELKSNEDISSSLKLEPGEELTAVANVTPGMSAGLPLGRYALLVEVGLVHDRDSPELGESRLGFGSGILFVVLPPEGALDTTVVVGQVREANGSKITLERIHFTPEVSTIVVLASPLPDELAVGRPIPAPTATPATRPQGAATPTPVPVQPGEGVAELTARYQIDGGAWHQLRGHGYRVAAEGVYHRWTFGPVSGNAKTLVLAIMSDSTLVAEWTVPLQGSGLD